MLDDNIIFRIETEINRIYAEVETEFVSAIAREITKGSTAKTSSVVWRTEKLRQMGRLEGKLTTLLKKKSRQIEPEIEKAIISSMLSAGEADDAILKRIPSIQAKIKAGTFVPTSKSSVFDQLASAAIANAKKGMNLTNTAALQASSEIWSRAVNDAYMKTLTGSLPLDKAVKRSVREMGKQGAFVSYISNSGRQTRTSLEVAVRRDVVTSVNQAAAEMTKSRCEENDLDLVEVTSHVGARPDHARWQGKVYSLGGKTKGYQTLEAATGYGTAEGLAGPNCRHSFYPYYPGLSKQNDDDVKLRENKEVYKATQKQRYLERNIRDAKRETNVCKAGGDPAGAEAATQRVRSYQHKMREHIKQTDLTRQYPREQIHS